ncbi:GNAT family N-acetyltransferase [Streptomyces sanglieri]|uniref:GNAT family N-acetyltransferase n=1 Tax=Streptomyces sanglieri TaxID=193460 RepID=A0ABW2X7U3_9ACTN|nr:MULTISPECIES: GNAT family N-acetyltransferase [unclassified Streptomyces]MCX4844504.1 GNAT family N-acetyltransferase [Streptomyces sp. NBC_00893]MDV9200517.1 GNAT family N-acetyltransferase [Streptomyces sp. Wh19]
MPASDTAVTASHQPKPQTDWVLTDAPNPEDVAAISGALDRFNIEHTGIADRRPLAVLVRDPETRQVVGGLTGRTSLGLFFLDLFYLPPRLRGSGLGTELLRQAEDEARARGCRMAVLYTITFQAPGFYQNHGWKRLGEVPCDPPGTSRVFMTKELTAPTGEPTRFR